jgi:hypothetical protein
MPWELERSVKVAVAVGMQLAAQRARSVRANRNPRVLTTSFRKWPCTVFHYSFGVILPSFTTHLRLPVHGTV